MPHSIDVVFTPDLLPFADLRGKIVVVVDILRATTTITLAMANGAISISPVLTPDDAFACAANQPGVLIGGERHGKKIKGFDLGNSPREYTQGLVSGKQIILTTTNGTRTLQACQPGGQVLVGSFLNLQAVIDHLFQVTGDVVVACSGREGGFCTEDTVFAGACVAAFDGAHLTDAAEAAWLLYQTHRDKLIAMLTNCYHGQYLTSIGLRDDLTFCAQTNLVRVVPHLVDGRITVPEKSD